MKTLNKTLVATLMLSGSLSTPVLAGEEWKDDANDAWIDGKAETTLLLNTDLNSFDINTHVENGVITLTGHVESEVDKALAEELVESLDGVKDVDNELTVMNEEDESSETLVTLTDSKVTTVVKARLLMESEVAGTAIEVETEDGVVTLKGEVGSSAEKQLAIAIARNTDDVESVIDKMTVSS